VTPKYGNQTWHCGLEAWPFGLARRLAAAVSWRILWRQPMADMAADYSAKLWRMPRLRIHQAWLLPASQASAAVFHSWLLML